MSINLIGIGCVATVSSYLTLAMVAETEPTVNEYGEEEYSIKGYLLLAGAFVIKWGIKKVMQIIGYERVSNEDDVIYPVEGEAWIEESSGLLNEYELVV